jgi:hypothetical protein
MIPFALCETAARLDPATPTYWIEAAELADSLGMPEKARAHRQMIERRAVEWRVAAGIEHSADGSPADEGAGPLPAGGPFKVW